VHRKYIQQDATLHSLFISGNCSTCFGWYFHPPSGAHTTASTASGICHTVTAICRYRGRVGAGFSVLWVVYATIHMKYYNIGTVGNPTWNSTSNEWACYWSRGGRGFQFRLWLTASQKWLTVVLVKMICSWFSNDCAQSIQIRFVMLGINVVWMYAHASFN
jgi:hypothetical protein